MSVLSDLSSAVVNVAQSLVRLTPTGITSDELMFDPSNLHGHQGNNDMFVLRHDADNFQLFRSHDDLSFIYGAHDVASYWGGGTQTIYDYGNSATLRFSEFDLSQVKIYNFENDVTGKVILYNPLPADTILQPDGTGGTKLGYIDFIGDKTVTMSQISFVHMPTNPSQGGLIPV
jgi:hypothetical protein